MLAPEDLGPLACMSPVPTNDQRRAQRAMHDADVKPMHRYGKLRGMNAVPRTNPALTIARDDFLSTTPQVGGAKPKPGAGDFAALAHRVYRWLASFPTPPPADQRDALQLLLATANIAAQRMWGTAPQEFGEFTRAVQRSLLMHRAVGDRQRGDRLVARLIHDTAPMLTIDASRVLPALPQQSLGDVWAEGWSVRQVWDADPDALPALRSALETYQRDGDLATATRMILEDIQRPQTSGDRARALYGLRAMARHAELFGSLPDLLVPRADRTVTTDDPTAELGTQLMVLLHGKDGAINRLATAPDRSQDVVRELVGAAGPAVARSDRAMTDGGPNDAPGLVLG